VLLPAKHSARSKLDVSLPHGKLLQKALTRTQGQRKRAALGVSEDAKSALRARMPEERVKISLFKMLVETLYSRRPLRPAARSQEFAAGQTFHPVDPPLEPQDGRLRSLRPNPQDEPDNAKKLPLNSFPPRCLV
jgi:hypothetical protein